MNVGKLAAKFRGVLSESVYLALHLRRPRDLHVELPAHLAELIVDNGQDVGLGDRRTAWTARAGGSLGSSRACCPSCALRSAPLHVLRKYDGSSSCRRA